LCELYDKHANSNDNGNKTTTYKRRYLLYHSRLGSKGKTVLKGKTNTATARLREVQDDSKIKYYQLQYAVGFGMWADQNRVLLPKVNNVGSNTNAAILSDRDSKDCFRI